MSFATKLMIAVIRNKSNPMAIKELNFNPSASPNWFAMILAIVLPAVSYTHLTLPTTPYV